jgi:hypothetical protein
MVWAEASNGSMAASKNINVFLIIAQIYQKKIGNPQNKS